MADNLWDSKLKAFLKKTGDDFKRAGADMKQEAERLLAEAKDPERAKKIKDGLAEVSGWAKKTAEEFAGYVETGVKKAEGAIKEVVMKPAGAPTPAPARAEKAADPVPEAPVTAPAAPAAPAAKAKKTVGRGTKKSAPVKKAGAKKPLGRSKR